MSFDAAKRGIKVSILSGDVHTSAVFRLRHRDQVIYQLTSSAITFNKYRAMGWLLGRATADEGRTADGYQFERIALYTDSNFSTIRVEPKSRGIAFHIYGGQKIMAPASPDERQSTEQQPPNYRVLLF